MSDGNKYIFRRHPRLASAVILSIVTLLLLLLAECGFLFGRYLIRGPASERHIVREHDSIGWVLNPEQALVLRSNRCGEEAALEPPVSEFLLYRPEEDVADRQVIWFVGDSTTHGHEAGTEYVYHRVFARQNKDVAVYATGVGGHGTLQQYLMIEEAAPEVRPDILVWQLDLNDIENNVYELDNSSLNNNQLPRPYLNPSTGEIVVRNPGFFLFDWSDLSAYLYARVLLPLDWQHQLGIVGALDRPFAVDPSERERLHRQGVQVMKAALSRTRTILPHTRVVGFFVGVENDSVLETAFGEVGFEYLTGFGEELAARAGDQPYNCAPLDFHWNRLGNRIAAEILGERLRPFMGHR